MEISTQVLNLADSPSSNSDETMAWGRSQLGTAAAVIGQTSHFQNYFTVSFATDDAK